MDVGKNGIHKLLSKEAALSCRYGVTMKPLNGRAEGATPQVGQVLPENFYQLNSLNFRLFWISFRGKF